MGYWVPALEGPGFPGSVRWPPPTVEGLSVEELYEALATVGVDHNDPWED